MISILFTLVICICTCSIVHAQTPPVVSVTITPSSVIVTGQNINFAATAQTFTNVNPCAVTFQYSLFQSPVPAVEAGPIIQTSAQATTDVININFPGLYIYTVTATDCMNQITAFNFNVRVLGGTYDNAIIRAAIDGQGTFAINGVSASTNAFSFKDGQTLSTTSTNAVQPGDVFSMIGHNVATTTTSPNPAMVAATITWRDMNFNTDAATWTCTNGDLTATTGSNAWAKPGFTNVLPAAVSQGTNVLGSTWSTLNNNKILQIAPEAQFLWTTSTLNFVATDTSVVSCRYVFNPPAEIVNGITFVTSAPPTTAPTTPAVTPTTAAPTTPAVTPTNAPGIPTAPLPVNNPTNPPAVSSTGGVVAPVNNQGQPGAANAGGGGGGMAFNPVFVVIPVVIVVAVIAIVYFIRQRRKSNVTNPDFKLSEQV